MVVLLVFCFFLSKYSVMKWIFLSQALWKNFVDNGPNEYISIESLDFDVPQEVLEQLVRADVVQEHPSNPDKIKMVDFTMST